VRVAAIYEGTNGIQAMDLLGRKLGMQGGQIFMNLLTEMQKTVARAKKFDRLQGLADKLAQAVNRLGETAMHMGQTAMSPDVKTAFAHACPFLDVVGDCIMAWMLLWRATVAAPAQDKLLQTFDEEARRKKIAAHKQAAFYEGQVRSAEYYIETLLPVTLGRMNSIQAGNAAVVDMPEAAFGGY